MVLSLALPGRLRHQVTPQLRSGTFYATHLCMMAIDNGTKNAISPDQVRAARALLDWPRDRLAVASGVPKRTLARFEGGEAVPRQTTIAKICLALEEAGIEFIPENGGGFGVRLRRPK